MKFSITTAPDKLDDIFWGNGSVGMIESNNYARIYIELPFMSTVIDFCCEVSAAAPVTAIFTK